MPSEISVGKDPSRIATQLLVGGAAGAVGIIVTNYALQFAPANTNPWVIAAGKAAIAFAGSYGLHIADLSEAGAGFGAVMLASAIDDAFEQMQAPAVPAPHGATS